MSPKNTDPTNIERIEAVKLTTLARKYGTPLYVYSYTELMNSYRRMRDAFADFDPLIAYSVKSNNSHAILTALTGEGCGLDIVSAGELRCGLLAGVDPAKVVFAGVGKTRAEITEALEAGIGLFNVESEPEAEAIAAVGRKLRKTASAALRVNPDIDASTHHYITTGKKENKFGIPFDHARKVFRRVAKLRGIDLHGLHVHIGSQIMDPKGFVDSLSRVIELLGVLRKDGHAIDTLNLGGGYGIDYEKGLAPLDMDALARRLKPVVAPLNLRLIFEPGRAISGPAGSLLTSIEYVKPGVGKDFAIIDGGMNDLLRPSLYSAYHRIKLVGPPRRGRKKTYDVVGPICESADFLGKARQIAPLRAGDLLLVCDAGAYGMAMASNYNARPRPAEVMVRGRYHQLIRERETHEDLVRNQTVPTFVR